MYIHTYNHHIIRRTSFLSTGHGPIGYVVPTLLHLYCIASVVTFSDALELHLIRYRAKRSRSWDILMEFAT